MAALCRSNPARSAMRRGMSTGTCTVPNMGWNYPTPIRFGANRIAELPDACRELGMKSPLLVTDAGLVSLDMVGEAAELCTKSGLPCGVFGEVKANPVEENVTAGVQALKAGGHDGVIAFGGGSALDAAKCIALMAGQTRPLFDFEDRADWWTRVDEEGMVPVVAVPTTSGTGSEVGRASVVTDMTDHTKKIIFHPKMLPERVILDPTLTVGLPKNLTAAVGIDALSHCLEAFCSPHYHPMAQGIALEGMLLVKDWLPKAVADGDDLDARAHMLVASMMGATAFQKGLGAMHSLSHPCGAVLDTHHGRTIAIVMPYVLQYNKSVIGDKMEGLARYLDMQEQSGHAAVLDWVLRLRADLGIEHTLAELGVSEEHLPTLAPMASVDPSTGSNPLPLSPQDAHGLYTRAIRGEL